MRIGRLSLGVCSCSMAMWIYRLKWNTVYTHKMPHYILQPCGVLICQTSNDICVELFFVYLIFEKPTGVNRKLDTWHKKMWIDNFFPHWFFNFLKMFVLCCVVLLVCMYLRSFHAIKLNHVDIYTEHSAPSKLPAKNWLTTFS